MMNNRIREWIVISIVWISIISLTYGAFPTAMVSEMDETIDPCENFYKYSCGGWMKTHGLKPTEKKIYLAFDKIDEKNREYMEAIIQDEEPVVTDYWHSCIDQTTNRGINSLEKELERISKLETKEQVVMMAGTLFRTGTNAFLKLTVSEDMKTPINMLYVTPPDWILPDAVYYTDSKYDWIKHEYEEYIHDLLKLSGIQGLNVSTLIQLQHKLASLEYDTVVDSKYMSITDAINHWPLIFGAFSKGIKLQERLKEKEKIYIYQPHYMTALEKEIQIISLNKLKDYLSFALIHSRIQWLGMEAYHIWFKLFQTKLRRKKIKTPDQHTICRENVLKHIPDLIGEYYYKKAFDTERNETAYTMIELIQTSMKDHIIKTEWLNPNDKQEARKKLEKIIPLIGHTTQPRSYPSVLSRQDYFDNMHKIMIHAFDLEINKVGQHVKRMEWDDSAAGVNAYYSPEKNTILFPAGILQPPLFNGRKFHPARNFGAIGTIMGHELTHGFDSSGREFDGDGNMRNWWSPSTTKAFDDHTKCFEKQYSMIAIEGEYGAVIGNVKGDLTLDENIADNGGLSLAWDAYRKHVKTLKPGAYGVEGDEGDKMFFIAYAQSLCMKVHDETMYSDIVRDPHAPSQARVNGGVMNSKIFATVFQCKVGDPMNPVNKCILW